MFQWLARKLVPLSLSKEEFPLWGALQKNAVNSCKTEHKKYQFHRSNLELLQDIKPNKVDFENYWKQIQVKLEEKPKEKETQVPILKVSYSQFFATKTFAIACAALFIGMIFIVPVKNTGNDSALSGKLNFSTFLINNLKKNDNSFDSSFSPDLYINNMSIDLKNQSFRLDQVINCKLESAKF